MGGNLKGMALSFSGGEGRNTTNFQEDFFLQPIDQIWVIHQREQDCSIWLELIQTSSPGDEYIAARIKLKYYLQEMDNIFWVGYLSYLSSCISYILP